MLSRRGSRVPYDGVEFFEQASRELDSPGRERLSEIAQLGGVHIVLIRLEEHREALRVVARW